MFPSSSRLNRGDHRPTGRPACHINGHYNTPRHLNIIHIYLPHPTYQHAASEKPSPLIHLQIIQFEPLIICHSAKPPASKLPTRKLTLIVLRATLPPLRETSPGTPSSQVSLLTTLVHNDDKQMTDIASGEIANDDASSRISAPAAPAATNTGESLLPNAVFPSSSSPLPEHHHPKRPRPS